MSLCPSVSCSPEDVSWMVIRHNNTELTRVHSSPDRHGHLAHFDYASEEEQLAAVISQSERCEQELSYLCRKSRILNTPGKTFTHWPFLSPKYWDFGGLWDVKVLLILLVFFLLHFVSLSVLKMDEGGNWVMLLKCIWRIYIWVKNEVARIADLVHLEPDLNIN